MLLFNKMVKVSFKQKHMDGDKKAVTNNNTKYSKFRRCPSFTKLMYSIFKEQIQQFSDFISIAARSVSHTLVKHTEPFLRTILYTCILHLNDTWKTT